MAVPTTTERDIRELLATDLSNLESVRLFLFQNAEIPSDVGDLSAWPTMVSPDKHARVHLGNAVAANPYPRIIIGEQTIDGGMLGFQSGTIDVVLECYPFIDLPAPYTADCSGTGTQIVAAGDPLTIQKNIGFAETRAFFEWDIAARHAPADTPSAVSFILVPKTKGDADTNVAIHGVNSPIRNGYDTDPFDDFTADDTPAALWADMDGNSELAQSTILTNGNPPIGNAFRFSLGASASGLVAAAVAGGNRLTLGMKQRDNVDATNPTIYSRNNATNFPPTLRLEYKRATHAAHFESLRFWLSAIQTELRDAGFSTTRVLVTQVNKDSEITIGNIDESGPDILQAVLSVQYGLKGG